jgi:hypothetical protein
VRAGYSSRPAAVRKRRSHDLTEDSSAADPPRSADPLTPSVEASRVAVRKNTRIGKAPTFDARTLEHGGSQP